MAISLAEDQRQIINDGEMSINWVDGINFDVTFPANSDRASEDQTLQFNVYTDDSYSHEIW